MFLIQYQTTGTEVWSDDESHVIGRDGIETCFAVVAHEDDCDQWADGECYQNVKILCEIEHADILKLYAQSNQLRAECAARGHALVDDDPGDPEVGPQPHVHCARCGHG